MKKIYLTSVLFFFLITISHSQWIPQGQGLLPDGYGIWDLSVVDEDIVWALATKGPTNSGNLDSIPEILIHSIDGGENWDIDTLFSLMDRNIVSLSAVSGDMAWLSTNDALGTRYFYQTINGGNNWVEKKSFPGNNPNLIYAPVIEFEDADKGHFVGMYLGKSGKTSSGGESWEEGSLLPGVSDEWFGFYCPQNWLEVKDSLLWYGTSKYIYNSLNGGLDWMKTDPGFPGNNIINSIGFNESGYGLAISDSDLNLDFIPSFLDYTIIWKSENFGDSWERIEDVAFPLSSLTHVPGEDKFFFAVSGLSEWLFPEIELEWSSAYTFDGGLTWVEIDSGIPYNGVDFASCNAGWAGTVGYYGYPNISGGKPALFKWEADCIVGSTDQKLPEYAVDVFPNPFSNFIKVNSEQYQIESIELYNSNGQLLMALDNREFNQFDFSGFPNGLYFLKIISEEGFVTRKIVKK